MARTVTHEPFALKVEFPLGQGELDVEETAMPAARRIRYYSLGQLYVIERSTWNV